MTEGVLPRASALPGRLWTHGRRLVGVLVERFAEHNVLTYASAIAFQLLVAVIPFAALSLLVMGYLGSEHVWDDQIAPRLREKMPPVTFIAVDAMVDRLLESPQLLWLALGIGITLWEVSGSVRAVMGATNAIYEEEEERGIVHRFGLSLALAVGVVVCVLGAGWSATFTAGIPLLPSAVELALRWLVAFLLLWLMLLMLLHFAPVRGRPVQWLSVGSALVIVAWLAASAVYGFYVQHVVSLRSAFGFVSVGLVTTGYLYTSSIIFLTGIEIDELRRRARERG